MKPCIVVGEDVSLTGGVTYTRVTHENTLLGKSRHKTYETKMKIEDEEEYTEGKRIRSNAYASIRRVCANTRVALMCPISKRSDLDAVVSEIKAQTKEFNKKAKTCTLRTNYVVMSVEEGDNDMISSVTNQIADIAKGVEDAISGEDAAILKAAPRRVLEGHTVKQVLGLPQKERDAIVATAKAERIRSVIAEAKGFEDILPQAAADEVRKMVKQSRQVARAIKKRVTKRGESLQYAMTQVNSAGISKTRLAFVAAASKAEEGSLDEGSLVEHRELNLGDE